MTLGESLRAARKRMGLAQLYLAAGAGVSQGYLSRIEAGKATPSAAIVVRLAQVVGADPKGLLQIIDRPATLRAQQRQGVDGGETMEGEGGKAP